MYVGYWIICSIPNLEITPPVLEPSYVVVMSLLYQRLDFTIKSPRTNLFADLVPSDSEVYMLICDL